MSTYRNIFFNENAFLLGNGNEEVYYTGKVYDNAVARSNFFQLYDKDKDLVISCNACAKKNVKFIKKAPIQTETFKESTVKSGIEKTPKTKAKISNNALSKKKIINPKAKKCKHC